MNISFEEVEYSAYIINVLLFNVGCIIKFANSKEAVVKWVLNSSFQCKYAKALKDITNTSNIMYTPNKCNQTKDITK